MNRAELPPHRRDLAPVPVLPVPPVRSLLPRRARRRTRARHSGDPRPRWRPRPHRAPRTATIARLRQTRPPWPLVGAARLQRPRARARATASATLRSARERALRPPGSERRPPPPHPKGSRPPRRARSVLRGRAAPAGRFCLPLRLFCPYLPLCAPPVARSVPRRGPAYLGSPVQLEVLPQFSRRVYYVRAACRHICQDATRSHAVGPAAAVLAGRGSAGRRARRGTRPGAGRRAGRGGCGHAPLGGRLTGPRAGRAGARDSG